MMNLWPSTGIVILALSSGFFPTPALGQSENIAPPEQPAESVNPQLAYNVKAAYLYGFGRYIQWPEQAFPTKDSPFVIGLVGDDPFEEVLNVIAKTKTIQGRRIVVQKTSVIEDLHLCHILFMPRTVLPELQFQIFDKLQEKSILLVGEIPGFVEHGGCVNFFINDDRVQFDLNVDVIRHKKLLVDAKLLGLGRNVSK